jgi:hypothetical protein
MNIGWINDTINGIAVKHTYPCHSSNYTNNSNRTVSFIGIHYSGNKKDTAQSNCKYFQTANRKASAHLFVDDTHIEQSVELRDSAWAIGCSQGYKTSARNSNSINIEMCCTAGNYKVSEKTQINTAYVCAYVCKLIGITANQVDTYVLRHYDCVKSNKACPKQYVDNPKEWTQFKTWVKNILNTGSHLGKTTEDYIYQGVNYNKVFDHKFYADANADLKAAFGYDKTKLFNHFINNGMTDADPRTGRLSRIGKTISTFNVEVYASHSPDLVKAFGVLSPKTAPSYYKHYCTNGYKEGRRVI